ncbi:olfactory receptor 4S2-like [Diceros bicornis minor]|uniref:olfactory receptor 4S2-like n=1 Tax=Diceros bicornis minor TaxID=77932 RepID=UPI0026EAB290|nr:olfactory receptor 4S2-like [Diceros bicornis minor]
MGHDNVTEFILLGLFSDEDAKVACFVLFSLFYIAILSGNLLILLTIRGSRLSEQPVYFFLSYLSFMDICFTSTVAPKLITDLLAERSTISYNGCLSQMFYAHFFGATEIFILVAMAYDCYAAICRPLHYMVIMSRRVCYVLVTASIIGAFIHSILHVLIIIELPFCGPSQIDHYFCDVFPLLKLTCTDTRLLVIVIITTTGVLSILTFLALVTSYIIILSTLRTRSSEGCRKAVSTCGSHIAVVFMFFLPLIFTYVPTAGSVSNDKVFALFYTMIAPMFNPLI